MEKIEKDKAVQICVTEQLPDDLVQTIVNALYREIERQLPARHDKSQRAALKRLVKATNRFRRAEQWDYHPVVAWESLGIVDNMRGGY